MQRVPFVGDVEENVLAVVVQQVFKLFPVVHCLVQIGHAVAACSVVNLENAYKIVDLAPLNNIFYFSVGGFFDARSQFE